VFFLLFKKNNSEKTLRVIFYYILYCIINEALGYYFQVIHFENYFIFFRLFTIAEFSFFSFFYLYIIPPGLVKKAVFPILGLFVILAVGNFFLSIHSDSFDSITIGIESILIILMCIYYLFVQIKGANNLFLYSTSNFWIIISFLIYISGTFFLYIMAKYMFNDRSFQIQYDIINSIFNILKNILLSVAMLMKPAPANNKLQKNNNWDDLLTYK
jgi:hypothetical protein